MPFIVKEDDWNQLFAKLDRLQTRVIPEGERMMRKTAKETDAYIREHLASQGRGGTPPPLSRATQQIYAASGGPDGSGILDHIKLDYQRTSDGFVAIVGIPQGDPTTVMQVQNRGAVVPVTDNMRGFLSAVYGIHLRAETTHIHIPGRHVWDYARNHAKKVLVKELSNFFIRVLT